MIIESKISWSAKQLADSYSKGIVNLENARQRGLIWKPDQKSLLIHSVITGFPIPNFYIVKNENQLDMIDGKQRTDAIHGYLNNEYALSKDMPLVETSTGEAVNISGKKFKDLPEEIQDATRNRMLDIHHVDNITDDELDDMFFRLNNAAAMQPIFMTCARTKCIEQINVAADHDIFKNALTAAKLAKYAHKDITIKAWIVLNIENPSFAAKDIQAIMKTADIDDDSIVILWDCFNRIFEAYKIIDQNAADNVRSTILTNIVKPTHFIALVLAAKYSIDNNVSVEDFSKWAMTFFPGTKIASIDDNYNAAARSGKKENVRIRHTAILNHYRSTFPTADEEASA